MDAYSIFNNAPKYTPKKYICEHVFGFHLPPPPSPSVDHPLHITPVFPFIQEKFYGPVKCEGARKKGERVYIGGRGVLPGVVSPRSIISSKSAIKKGRRSEVKGVRFWCRGKTIKNKNPG